MQHADRRRELIERLVLLPDDLILLLNHDLRRRLRRKPLTQIVGGGVARGETIGHVDAGRNGDHVCVYVYVCVRTRVAGLSKQGQRPPSWSPLTTVD